MRLDKFIAHQLAISRTQAGAEIKAGSVAVNYNIVRERALQVSSSDSITHNGTALMLTTGNNYIMLNKPSGYVCARQDHHHRSVFTLLPSTVANQLHVAGRLDVDTTGLVLLTDDGQWSHRITSPRYACEKRYLATLAKPLTQVMEQQFARGILLRGEKHTTRPARIEKKGQCAAYVMLSEGRYHQVKRMFAAVGNHVLTLQRLQVGAIVLDERLQPGQFRPLTLAEIAAI